MTAVRSRLQASSTLRYEGKNTVKTEPDYTGAAIKAQDGTNQKAELNITSSNSTDAAQCDSRDRCN